MLGRTYDDQVCSIARALEVVGERWTLLVIRDAMRGRRRFDDFQHSLGISRPVLTDRLNRLVDEGVLERRRYQERPERFEYRLTEKGRGLWKVIAHLLMWGDEHYPAPGGPPRVLLHRDCGGRIDDRLRCERCGRDVEGAEVDSVDGPGLRAAALEDAPA
jgi:DNA-binding HxlR family transcriptional regulator